MIHQEKNKVQYSGIDWQVIGHLDIANNKPNELTINCPRQVIYHVCRAREKSVFCFLAHLFFPFEILCLWIIVQMVHLPVLFLLVFSQICLTLKLVPFCAGEDHFAYSGFTGAGNTSLTLDGAARVTPEGLLELTNNVANTKGHAFYPTPFQFKKSLNGTVQSFSVAFVFSIASAYSEASTDGMAFFISPDQNFSDAMSAQYMGLLNS